MDLLQPKPVLQERGLLLFFPLLLFPFLTLLFWAGGGGKDTATSDANGKSSGLNTRLPDARFKSDNESDKLSSYLQATRDSARKEEQKDRDPFWSQIAFDSAQYPGAGSVGYSGTTGGYDPLPPAAGKGMTGLANSEARVHEKISRLNQMIAGSQQSAPERETPEEYRSAHAAPDADDRRRMEMLSKPIDQEESDPELKQLNTMLDKIAAIQHPDSPPVTNAAGGDNGSRNSLRVRNPAVATKSPLTLQQAKDGQAQKKTKSAFYSENVSSRDTTGQEVLNTFSALVPRTQIAVDGSTIQLQLLQDIEVGGIIIPKGNYLSGMASLSGERLLIKIKSIRVSNDVYPVSLEVYDMDGLSGIHTPGSSTAQDAVRQSSGRMANSFGLTSLDPSIGAQAASTGIEVARSLMSKKVKLIKITVPAGYRIFLKDSGTN